MLSFSVLQMTAIPNNCCGSDMPVPEKTLHPYLEKNLTDEELACYLLPEKTLLKYWRILDVRQRTDVSSCCFTKAYTHYAEGTGSVLQHDVNESFHKKFAEFQEDGDVTHLKPLQLRYFTPREIANLMGFPAQFSFPENVSFRTRYRLLGNSLNVIVVSCLLKILLQ